MYIKRITETYAVTGQIRPEDIPAIKEAGFKSIMCNRHDDETENQPSAQLIEQIAKEHGITFYHVPIGDEGIGLDTLKGFSKVMKGGKYPVLAYCHTGGRCTRLWDAFNS